MFLISCKKDLFGKTIEKLEKRNQHILLPVCNTSLAEHLLQYDKHSFELIPVHALKDDNVFTSSIEPS